MKLRRLLHIFLAITIVLLAISPSIFMRRAEAAGSFTDASLTISDSRAGATSVTYDFAMTATSSAAIKQLDIYFCTNATQTPGSCNAPSGMNTGTPTLGTENITGTGESVSKISGGNNTIRVSVGTPLTQSP